MWTVPVSISEPLAQGNGPEVSRCDLNRWAKTALEQPTTWTSGRNVQRCSGGSIGAVFMKDGHLF